MARHVQSLTYSLVARGSVLLADYSAFTSASFSTIAALCLPNLATNSSSNNMLSYICDRHIFNFLVQDGFIYLVVSDDSTGRELPFACLHRIKEDFEKRYGDGNIIDMVTPHILDIDFGPKLKEHMQYCVDHSKEVKKLAIVKAQVPEVKDIMMENIDKEHMQYCVDHPQEMSIFARDSQTYHSKDLCPRCQEHHDGGYDDKMLDGREKTELLVDNIEILRVQAENFDRQGKQLRRKMWLHHMKVRLVVVAVVILLILLVWLSICKGFVC